MNMLLSVVTVQRLVPVHRLPCAAASMPSSTLVLLGRRLPCSAAASMPSSTLVLLGRRLHCSAASMPTSTLVLLGRRLHCAAASMPTSTLVLLGRRLHCAAASMPTSTLVLLGRRLPCAAASMPSSTLVLLGRRLYGSAASSRVLVLGIESSCDDTGAAVLDHTGTILGEALHCQNEVHLRTGGIIPPVAQQLHRDHIHRVVQEALDQSGVTPGQLSAVATTVKPGMGLSLGVGLEFSLNLVRRHGLPFIPIHHMEAHALTVRMLRPDLHFPFLVLLVSGGHSLLAVARGVDDFLLLGQSLDEAPGEALDKIARRLSLTKHPECSALSGGQAIELLAKRGDRRALAERAGDRRAMTFRTPMGMLRDCNFSFAGFRNQVTMEIVKREKEEGVEEGTLLSCVCDIAAAAQHTVASHLAKRTHRAILFCHSRGLLAPSQPSLVVSGGVASNQYIRSALAVVTEATGLQLICPPAKFCTDNGVMIAWNGVERLREGRGLLSPDVDVRYEPKAPLGVDISAEVKAASIKLPPLQLRIKD